MSISDEMMENYYTLLTDIPAAKIKELVDSQKTHPKQAKVFLGKTVIKQFYDEAVGETAAAEFENVFAQKQMPQDIPEVKISGEPITAAKLLSACNLVASGGEAKRLIAGGGMSIDSEKVTDPNKLITPVNGMIVRAGKLKFAKLIIQ
jgi:tyrosyl-tRNA synthetase